MAQLWTQQEVIQQSLVNLDPVRLLYMFDLKKVHVDRSSRGRTSYTRGSRAWKLACVFVTQYLRIKYGMKCCGIVEKYSRNNKKQGLFVLKTTCISCGQKLKSKTKEWVTLMSERPTKWLGLTYISGFLGVCWNYDCRLNEKKNMEDEKQRSQKEWLSVFVFHVFIFFSRWQPIQWNLLDTVSLNTFFLFPGPHRSNVFRYG